MRTLKMSKLTSFEMRRVLRIGMTSLVMGLGLGVGGCEVLQQKQDVHSGISKDLQDLQDRQDRQDRQDLQVLPAAQGISQVAQVPQVPGSAAESLSSARQLQMDDFVPTSAANTSVPDLNALPVLPNIVDHLALPAKTYDVYQSVLADAEHRVTSELAIPAVLKPSVNFWLQIYGRYGSTQTVIFDPETYQILDVVDNTQTLKTSKTAILAEIYMRNRLQKTLKGLRVVLNELRSRRPKTAQQILIAKRLGNYKRIDLAKISARLKTITGLKDSLKDGIMRAEPFYANMQQIFLKTGVPAELVALCMVESSFNMKAYSRVGAAGVWQFMPAVSKKTLLMNDNIDERLNIIKSTLAAAKLLKNHYSLLHNWTLAVISYNHGFKGLPRFKNHSVKFSQIAHLFTSLKTPLGWASKNYYSEFLAANLAISYKEKLFGIKSKVVSREYGFETAKLKRSQTALQFAFDQNIPIADFIRYNGDVFDLSKPLPVGFELIIPLTNRVVAQDNGTVLKTNAQNFVQNHSQSKHAS
jgi:membrane-bound lytic murein transglycosylase D